MPGSRIALLACLLALAACGASRLSTTSGTTQLATPVNRVAIAPGSGVMGDAIGVELFNIGITVIETADAVAVLGRSGLAEFEIVSAQGLAALNAAGIEAVLTAKSVASEDGTPESASVRVTSTASGELLAGVTWQNGWGGQRGSIMDRSMRQNLSSAAQEIASELRKRLRPIQK